MSDHYTRVLLNYHRLRTTQRQHLRQYGIHYVPTLPSETLTEERRAYTDLVEHWHLHENRPNAHPVEALIIQLPSGVYGEDLFQSEPTPARLRSHGTPAAIRARIEFYRKNLGIISEVLPILADLQRSKRIVKKALIESMVVLTLTAGSIARVEELFDPMDYTAELTMNSVACQTAAKKQG